MEDIPGIYDPTVGNMRVQAVDNGLAEAYHRGIQPTDANFRASVTEFALEFLNQGRDEDGNDDNPFIPGARQLILAGELVYDEGIARDIGIDVDAINAGGLLLSVQQTQGDHQQASAQNNPNAQGAAIDDDQDWGEDEMERGPPGPRVDRRHLERLVGEYHALIERRDFTGANAVLRDIHDQDPETARSANQDAVARQQQYLNATHDGLQLLQYSPATDAPPSSDLANPAVESKRGRVATSSPQSDKSGEKPKNKKTKTASSDDQDSETETEDEVPDTRKSKQPKGANRRPAIIRANHGLSILTDTPLGKQYVFVCHKGCNPKKPKIINGQEVSTYRDRRDLERHMRDDHAIPAVQVTDKKGKKVWVNWVVTRVDGKKMRWYGTDWTNGDATENWEGDMIHQDQAQMQGKPGADKTTSKFHKSQKVGEDGEQSKKGDGKGGKEGEATEAESENRDGKDRDETESDPELEEK